MIYGRGERRVVVYMALAAGSGFEHGGEPRCSSLEALLISGAWTTEGWRVTVLWSGPEARVRAVSESINERQSWSSMSFVDLWARSQFGSAQRRF